MLNYRLMPIALTLFDGGADGGADGNGNGQSVGNSANGDYKKLLQKLRLRTIPHNHRKTDKRRLMHSSNRTRICTIPSLRRNSIPSSTADSGSTSS